MTNMLVNVRSIGNRIYADWIYNMSYDRSSGTIRCECKGWVMSKNKECRHTKEFRKMLEDKYEIKPKAVEEDKRHTEEPGH